MDPATLLGIALAFISLLIMMVLEGSSPMSIVLPAPLILVFGATFGAAMAGMSLRDNLRIPVFFKQALLPVKVPSASELIGTLVSLAEKARKAGLLELEKEADKVDNPFLKKGLQLAVDGTDPDSLRDILMSEIVAKKAEDKIGSKFFTDMGGYAPTVGIIGTVVGLIHVLENLAEPEKLGHLISAAFVATLWGVLSANLMWLPMGKKIARVSELEVKQMELVVEGISEIQSGTTPRTIRLKLSSLVPPSEVEKEAA